MDKKDINQSYSFLLSPVITFSIFFLILITAHFWVLLYDIRYQLLLFCPIPAVANHLVADHQALIPASSGRQFAGGPLKPVLKICFDHLHCLFNGAFVGVENLSGSFSDLDGLFIVSNEYRCRFTKGS